MTRRMRAAERRESILDAAEATFARLGYRGATMADIAAAAGVTQPMLYRHFSSKRELFLAALDRSAARIEEAWRAAPTLLEMGRRYLQLSAAELDAVRLRWQALVEAEDPSIHRRLEQNLSTLVGMVREAIRRERQAGRLAAPADEEGAAWLFTGLGLLIDFCLALNPQAEHPGILAAAKFYFRLLAGKE